MEKNEVYQILRDNIINLELEPGMLIGEIETSKKFNISRTPIRDIFKRLVSDGLLEIIPHVGTYVAKIDVDRISDTLYIREKIEAATLKDLINTISPTQIVNLECMISMQENLIDNLSKEASIEERKVFARSFLELDTEFHKKLYEFTGRLGVWNYLFEKEYHYKRYRIFLNMNLECHTCTILNEHKEILSLIIDKNAEELERLVANHIYTGIRSISTHVNSNEVYFKK